MLNTILFYAVFSYNIYNSILYIWFHKKDTTNNSITRFYEKINRKEIIMSKANILFKTMEEKGISAKQLSNDTGISTGNISDWKNGRSNPSISALLVISNYLDVSVDYLLGNDRYCLTENEQILIDKYRKMNNDQQEHLLKSFEL